MGNEVRLVDANALDPELQKVVKEYKSNGAYEALCRLRSAPTIDPESLRPKGRWEKHDKSRYGAPPYFCSCCFDIWESVQIKNMKYCPSCGAKMEGM